MATTALFWLRKPVYFNPFIVEGRELMNEAVLWGNNAHGAGPGQKGKQRRQLPRPLASWMLGLVDGEYLREAQLSPAAPSFARRTGDEAVLDRQSLLKLIRRTCKKHGLNSSRVEAALKHPATTARLAYRLAKISAAKLGFRSDEVALALVVFRVGTSLLLSRRQCELCFRASFPGQRRCQFHSRSKGVMRDGAIQAARTARAIMAPSAAIRDAARSRRNIDTRDRMIAGAIFPIPRVMPGSWRSLVLRQLASCPNACALLPPLFASLSPAKLLAELRRAIDPDDWDVEFWPQKIMMAEQWLVMAKAVAPGAPPIGPRALTRARVLEAKKLRDGGVRVADIAARMGVSAANVYQMLHRHGVR